VTLASQRYSAVKEAIENALPGKIVSQVGSFQRKTRIRPIDLSDGLDVDAVVSFGKFYRFVSDGSGTTPRGALETVRRGLVSNETYKIMTPESDHPALCLQYADSMTIELIPVFEDATGLRPHNGSLSCYIFGDKPNAWEPCDYDYDAAVISALNVASSYKLVPSVKMVKAYFRKSNVPLKSFHTELLVANTVPVFVPDWREKGYFFGYNHIMAAILETAAKTVTSPMQIKGSYTRPVDSGLDNLTLTKIGRWLEARAQTAWSLCKIQDETEALRRWREFLGDPFPC
jgi:hypothetical protein